MIQIGLSPNLRISDSLLALRLLFQPWRWKIGKETRELESWFKKYLGIKGIKQAVALNSGRSAEYAILKSLGVGQDDEVLLQAFTCVAVPNSILWLGARPVYVDIDESLTMDPTDLEKKITSKSKAIIVQHTFGIPAKIKKILEIARKHDLIVIEDCAHIVKREITSEAAFFSFGRDKAISSIFGGMAITNEKLKYKNEKLKCPPYFWIFQQLLHPLASLVILPLYNLGLGKVILWTLQKLHLLSFPVYQEEKVGKRPAMFPAKLPNALAILALAQLKDIDEFNKKRAQFAKIYKERLKDLPVKLPPNNNLAYLRYPILTERADQLRRFAKKKGIILGDWYSHVVDPKGVDLAKVGYQQGSCPVAEKAARQVVNLPTYPRMSKNDAKKVVKVIYDFYQRNK